MDAGASPVVVQVLTCDDWGGTEIQVLRQIRALAGRVEQGLVTLSGPGPIGAAVASIGVPVRSLGPACNGVLLMRLIRALRSLRADVVETYGFRAGLMARPAARAAGARHVIGVRGIHFTEGEDESDRRSRFAVAVERRLQPTVAAYAANSQGAADRLVEAGIAPGRMVVVPNAIGELPPREPREPDGVLRVACVARFIPRKRHDVLLDAASLLQQRGVAVRLDLIGHGPLEAGLRAAIGRPGAPETRLLGRLGQAATFAALREADVLVLASTWEGSPGVVLEAMALGLPVVATDVPGTRELVRPDTGVLVAPGSAVALADALGAMAADPVTADAMGRAGRRHARDEFGTERLAERKLALYERVLAPVASG